jgi:3-deoxy-D-manno-octulosonic-acid transferase
MSKIRIRVNHRNLISYLSFLNTTAGLQRTALQSATTSWSATLVRCNRMMTTAATTSSSTTVQYDEVAEPKQGFLQRSTVYLVRHSERLDDVDEKGWKKHLSKTTHSRNKASLVDDPPITENG